MSKSVFVGLSGGVDSSVAALRLIKAGYRVTGVFIKVWHPDFLVCNWEQERLDAMRVAARLGIPFLTCDAETEYRDEVAAYFIESYRNGLTPNPDVMCNKEVKFGAFYRFAMERGADFISTGHYAQIKLVDQEVEMHRGVDNQKDQSYFLWMLKKDVLKKVLFPVGNSEKDVIREEAREANLLTADKRDSQGVCFLGQIDIPDFLGHYIDLKEGAVLDEAGMTIGVHKGAFVYTVGQRQGFLLEDSNTNRTPHYVVAKNIVDNTITVSSASPVASKDSNIKLQQCVLNASLKVGDILSAQSRYRQTPFSVEVLAVTDSELSLLVNNQTEALASGQSCVLYRGSHCLGGGIIA